MAAIGDECVTLSQLKLIIDGMSTHLDTFWQGSASLDWHDTIGGGSFSSNVTQISANKITDTKTNDRRITWTFDESGVYTAQFDCLYRNISNFGGDEAYRIQTAAYARLPGETENKYIFTNGESFTLRLVVESGQTFYIELPSSFQYEESLSANIFFERIV